MPAKWDILQYRIDRGVDTLLFVPDDDEFMGGVVEVVMRNGTLEFLVIVVGCV